MAEHTKSSIVINAGPATIMEVIADFAAYPEWAPEVSAAEIIQPGLFGQPEQVKLVINAGPVSDHQVFAYEWHDKSVNWSLVSSRMLSALDGSYTLTATDDGRTSVTYTLDVHLRIPMLGMMKRRAEKVIIDRALPGLKRRAELQEATR